MKKILPLSKIPNDIKYRLGLVTSRVEDIGILLASLDPTAWPGGEHSALTDALVQVSLRLAAVQAARPRKRTEEVEAVEAAPEAVQIAAPEVLEAVTFTTLDEVVEAPVAEEPALEAAPEADPEEARRARKRERDRLSAARRRADRLDARAEALA
jgi:hypothetical protein